MSRRDQWITDTIDPNGLLDAVTRADDNAIADAVLATYGNDARYDLRGIADAAPYGIAEAIRARITPTPH